MFGSTTRLAAAATALIVIAAAFVPATAQAASAPSPTAVSGAVPTLPPPPDRPQTLSAGALDLAASAVRRDTADRVPLQDGADIDRDVLRVEVTFADADAATAAVAAAGGTGIRPISDAVLVADIPVRALAELEAHPTVLYLQLPADLQAPVADPNSVASTLLPMAGVAGRDIMSQVRVSSWHTRGYKGTGVAVGIIDYFNASVWNSALGAGEVPAYSGTFCRAGGAACALFSMSTPTGNHGVAVAEAIHDVAPNAKLYLATVSTYEDLRAAIDYFASKGVTIISRSLGSGYDGSGRGDGTYNALASYAVTKGITWFNSAGNSGVVDQAGRIGGYWRGTWSDSNADGWNEFLQEDGSRSTIAWFNGRNCRSNFIYGLRWSDATGGATDYDLYYVDAAGGLLNSAPHNLQSNGAPAIEKAAQWCPAGTAGVAIYKRADGNGTAGDVLELMVGGYLDRVASNPYSAGQPIADSADPGVASIGAVDPVGGRVVAPYSAWGPSNDGRIKPDLSAGSNFTSHAYRTSSGRFNGTSAATPVAAGAAALLRQRYPSWTPAQLLANMKAIHMGERGDPGPDNVYGAGELVLDQLFTTLPVPTVAGTLKEGQVLTARVGTWSPSPSSFLYQWFREGTAITGATSPAYRLTAADAGARIRIRVTPVKLNFIGESRVSAYSAKVVALKTFTTVPTPRITGTAAVGSALTASIGAWSPSPTAYRYKWRRDGVPIPGATTRFYRLTAEDAGAQVTVTVAGTRTGYRTASKMSAPVTIAGGTCTVAYANGGFESGVTGWTSSPATGLILADGAYARTGSGYAWLGGNGVAATDSVSRSVALPTGCAATLTYQLRIATNEATTTAFDTLTVRVGTTIVQTLSNQDAAAGFVQRQIDLSAYAGQTVTLSWTSVEDADTLTSFLLDDTAITAQPPAG